MHSLLWAEISPRLDAIVKPLPLIVSIAVILFVYHAFQPSQSNAPILNGRKGLELTNQRPKKEYVSQATKLVGNWFKSNPNKPVRLISDVEEITVLPPSLAQEIRSDKRLSFSQWTFKVCWIAGLLQARKLT
jgi:hypothetical protein